MPKHKMCKKVRPVTVRETGMGHGLYITHRGSGLSRPVVRVIRIVSGRPYQTHHERKAQWTFSSSWQSLRRSMPDRLLFLVAVSELSNDV